MRKRIAVLLMALLILVVSVTPAFADSGRPRRPQPDTPPGLAKSGVDRPEQAPTPDTGHQNADEHRHNF